MKKKKSSSKIAKYYLLTSFLLIFFSHLVAIGYSNPSPVFNGMYINYIHSDSTTPGTEDAQIKFTRVTNEIYHVIWTLGQGGGSWDENLNSRVVSNTNLPGPEPGTHTWTRILTNVSLNQNVPIFIYTAGDQNFNVTAELNWTLPSSAKSVEVYELKDSNGSIVWYEKTTGIFLNGTFRYSGFWKKAEFVSSNALNTASTLGFPVFGIIIGVTVLSVSVICAVLLIKYKLNRT